MGIHPAYITEYEADKTMELTKRREYTVAKHNDFVRGKFDLKTREHKILNFMVSEAKPGEDLSAPRTFNIRTYCEVYGIDYTGGANYKTLKSGIKSLASQSVFIKQTNEAGEIEEVLVRIIKDVTMNRQRDLVTFTFDPKILPYIENMKKDFTSYKLYFTIPMKSKWSLRFYDVFKSHASQGYWRVEYNSFIKDYFIKYKRWQDVRVNVINAALGEINEYSDLIVTCKVEKYRGSVTALYFDIRAKDPSETMLVLAANEKTLLGFTNSVVVDKSENNEEGEQVTLQQIAAAASE